MVARGVSASPLALRLRAALARSPDAQLPFPSLSLSLSLLLALTLRRTSSRLPCVQRGRLVSGPLTSRASQRRGGPLRRA
mmetsp:Transcript_23278/g.55369  ORF Transcript_23278/g.55369 Transcript_23278/m.55369 type:complete len:80 (+) Transcript_23278:223-462(+)